ncbi:outer membrane protein assembly factor BamA [Buchnera aphidicola]|uniref:outer membrane protein assembly factor BamA n=1 Tax=Buchnera aphidicola TaxID=9 RepID=UPI00094DBE6A|nr:outer membrane protein assembly factor BamA [Buchnera aphidicola]
MFDKIFVFLGILFFSTTIFPVKSCGITRIYFHGIQHSAKSKIVRKMMVNHNRHYSSKDIIKKIEKLFNTNYFINIRVKKIKNSFFFYVTEYPKIKKIYFSGNHIFSNLFLKNRLRQFNMMKNDSFDINKYNRFLFFLKQCYFNCGIFGVHIEPLLVKSLNNTVFIKIKINENPYFNLSKIQIKGNKTFSESFIFKKFFPLYRPIFLRGWLQKQYTFNELKKYLLNLKNFYKKNGFLNIKINRLKFFEDKDRNNISVIIILNEGKKYQFKKIVIHQFKSLFFNKNENKKYILIPSSKFNSSGIPLLKQKIKRLYAKIGFSNTKIFMHYDIDEKNSSVILKIFVYPQRQFFINNIYFSGNKKSKYLFLRKVINQSKYAYLNKYSLKESCQNLLNTHLFDSVSMRIYKSKDALNMINICFFLKEKNDNQVAACSLGYDATTGLLLRSLYSNKNVLGLGRTIYAKIIKNLQLTNLHLSIIRPLNCLRNFTLKSRYFFHSLENIHVDPSKYLDKYFGFDIKLSSPVINKKKFFVSLGTFSARFPNLLSQFSLMRYIASLYKNKKFSPVIKNTMINDFIIKYIFDYNNINQKKFLKTGDHIKVKGKFTLPGSENYFHKITVTSDTIFPLEPTKNFLLHIYSTLGIGLSFGKKIFPLYENYYAGGLKSIRGFKIKSLGPTALYCNIYNLLYKKKNKITDQTMYESTHPLGGNILMNTNMELLFPQIHTTNSLVRFFQYGFFLDTVNIWMSSLKYMLSMFKNTDINKLYNPSTIYMSTGIFFRFFSFLGPMTITFAVPLLFHNIPTHNLLNFHIDFNKF